MESRAILGVVCAGALALTLAAARADVTQTGQYALPQGKPKIVSRLSLKPSGDLIINQYASGSHRPIAACASRSPKAPCYVPTEDEAVHVILVRDDFGEFSHIHPQRTNGVYSIHVALEPRHRYYAFVASRLSGMPEQVFRFVLQPAAGPAHTTATTLKPSAKATAGPYQLLLDQRRVHAGKTQTLNADIRRDPHAPGIAPYHVAWVRAILVNTSSLTYGHIDIALDQGICCEYALRTPALSKGLYKMWLQFDDGNAIYTAPFTFVAQ